MTLLSTNCLSLMLLHLILVFFGTLSSIKFARRVLNSQRKKSDKGTLKKKKTVLNRVASLEQFLFPSETAETRALLGPT